MYRAHLAILEGQGLEQQEQQKEQQRQQRRANRTPRG